MRIAAMTMTAAFALLATAAAAQTIPEAGAPLELRPAEDARTAAAARDGSAPDGLARCAAAQSGDVVFAAPLEGRALRIAGLAGRVEQAAADGWSQLAANAELVPGDEVILSEGAHLVLDGADPGARIDGPALLRLGEVDGYACLAREEVRTVAQDQPPQPVNWAGGGFMAAAGIGAIVMIATEGDDTPTPPVSP